MDRRRVREARLRRFDRRGRVRRRGARRRPRRIRTLSERVPARSE